MENELTTLNTIKGDLPDPLATDDYYVLNDHFLIKEMEVRNLIADAVLELDPWESEFARRYANGETINALYKAFNKTQKTLKQVTEKPHFLQVVHLWQHLKILQDGPNELLRKQMLWRIAKDNEKTDPKEATKALVAINAMENEKRGIGSNKIEIIINNEMMPRGALDD